HRKVSEEKHFKAVSNSKFVALWNTFTAYIVAMTPASDLCSLCQLNNAKISQNVNVSKHEKLKCLSDQETHLQEAKSEWDFMKRNIAACKDVLQDSIIDLLSPRPSCSLKGTIHYSYDYAQQVHIPSSPQQPGPINFKTPQKCGLHTKYSPDWCFGLVKQSFRRRYVSSLFDLMEAVDKSTVSGDNVPKLCGLQDGTVLVPSYDRQTADITR
ncbi:unnamed protein product, partial [Porites lobata]